MRRTAMMAGLVVALAIGGCGGGGSGGDQNKPAQNAASGGGHTPATIAFWNGSGARELGVIKKTVAAFHRTHPWITVKVVGSVNDDKIISAIRGGNAPDVAQSFTADNTGAFCNSGGWIDLNSYMQRDNI